MFNFKTNYLPITDRTRITQEARSPTLYLKVLQTRQYSRACPKAQQEITIRPLSILCWSKTTDRKIKKIEIPYDRKKRNRESTYKLNHLTIDKSKNKVSSSTNALERMLIRVLDRL